MLGRRAAVDSVSRGVNPAEIDCRACEMQASRLGPDALTFLNASMLRPRDTCRMRLEPSSRSRRMLVLNGHPDPRPERFCAALCDAYEHGARRGGWQTERLNVGALGYSLFGPHDGDDVSEPDVPEMRHALDMVGWADRMMVAYPLWLDRAPPALNVFLHEAARRSANGTASNVANKPGRVVVTMQMPAFIYLPRKCSEANRCDHTGGLALPGVQCGAATCIGSIDALSVRQRAEWLERIFDFGENGA